MKHFKEQLKNYTEDLAAKYFIRWNDNKHGFRGIDDLKQDEAAKLAGLIGLTHPNYEFEPLVEPPNSDLIMATLYRVMSHDKELTSNDVVHILKQNAVSYFRNKINEMLEDAFISYRQSNNEVSYYGDH